MQWRPGDEVIQEHSQDSGTGIYEMSVLFALFFMEKIDA